MHGLKVCAMLMFVAAVTATTAHAITGAITLNGCPGDAYATHSGSLDCVNGSSVQLLVTVAPSHDIPDMDEIEVYTVFHLLNSDFATSPYWDPDFWGIAGSQCPVAIKIIPVSGCPGYISPFGNPAHRNIIASKSGTNAFSFGVARFDPTPLAVAAGQPLIGFRLSFDNAHAGSCAGCSTPVRVDLTYAYLHSHSAIYSDQSAAGPTPMDTAMINEVSVPALPRTWGQLKQLYR